MPPVDGKCPDGYPMKANDNSGIFHVPGGRFYDRTVAERCYANADDAIADGYRPAKACNTETRSSRMKVSVDFDVCASTGACMQICPEVFEVRSDGYLYILQEEPPEELRAARSSRPPTCARRQPSPSRAERRTAKLARSHARFGPVWVSTQVEAAWEASQSMLVRRSRSGPCSIPGIIRRRTRGDLRVLHGDRRCDRRHRVRVQAAVRLLRRAARRARARAAVQLHPRDATRMCC